MRNGMIMGALALVLAGGAIAAPQAPKTRGPKSQAEAQALQALFASATPDAQIAAAEDFVVKFPQSDFKAVAYLGEAQSYQQKGDYDHTVVAGEQALESDPDDTTKVEIELLLAQVIGPRIGEFDLDREEKLTKVEKYANAALEALKTMAKPNPNLPDAQWEEAKASMNGQAHAALGVDQIVRKDYAKAAAEFTLAVEATKGTEPSYEVRLANALDKGGKYDEAIAACDKALATPNLHPMVKRAAEAEKANALKLKSSAAPAPAAAKP
jgi:tetratricopeptide (TPR) repeat protein